MAICNWVFQAPKHYLVKVPLLGCGSPQNRLHEHHEGRGFYLMRLLLYPLYLEPSTWHTNLDKYLISDRCILSCKYPHLPLDGSCALSVQFSRSVVSDSLRPHKLQHSCFPVHHQLPELTQTCVQTVGDAIQSSRPLSPPSPLAFNLSHHQGLFK